VGKHTIMIIMVVEIMRSCCRYVSAKVDATTCTSAVISAFYQVNATASTFTTGSHAYNVMPVVGVELSLQSTLVFSVLVKQDFKRIMRPGSSYDAVPMTKLMQLRSLIHQNISPNW